MKEEKLSCPCCGYSGKPYIKSVKAALHSSIILYECKKCGANWYKATTRDVIQKENEDMKEEKKIDWDKPLRRKSDNLPANFKCGKLKRTDGFVYAVTMINYFGNEEIYYFNEEGVNRNREEIENVPEKQEAWVNIHEKKPGRLTQSTHLTKAVADAMAGEFRTARIKLEWEEGQFDE